MTFGALVLISLGVFLAGLIYKVSTWFTRRIGIAAVDIPVSGRVASAFRGILGVVFSPKIVTLLKVFILDVLLQRRILKEDVLRWTMHMLLYAAFMLLLLMHALEDIITSPLLISYYSTVNPYYFLRDLLGAMVIFGLGIAIYRRFILKVPRLSTNPRDHYAIIILAVIMISGVFLSGSKITSHTAYQEMVEEYGALEDEREMAALESFWVEEFDVVSPSVKGPFDEDLLAEGEDLHQMNCAECHSKPQWAFMSDAVAKLSKPIALSLDRLGATRFLWWVHILACLIGLAYLPFSKMFHIIASPLSLLANAVMDRTTSNPANVLTRQVMELDACMHCTTCSLRCSAASAYDAFGNTYILPSEKMVFLRKLVAGKQLNDEQMKAIEQGMVICTNCDRCTVVCPAGIMLKDLWFSVREALIQKGIPEPAVLSPYSFYRGLNRDRLEPADYQKPLNGARNALSVHFDSLMDAAQPISLTKKPIDQRNSISAADTFSYCYSCQNCTSVCPVVESYEEPEKELGLLPHQIMCCLGLGLVEMASGPNMLWDCVTCYQCEEHCPQNVKVTDLLFQLKNLASKKVRPG
jgi:heterodisulfide reductase subunit C/nitrate reductase gamma subunit